MEGKRITRRGQQTRQRIIEETAQQMLAAGIGGTTLDTVGAATLTSRSQLFHYFPGGKTELIREVALWEGAQLHAAQAPELDDLGTWASWERWRQRLVEYYFGLGRWACPIGSLAAQAAMTDPGLEALIRDSMAAWRETLAAGIRRLQTGGHVDPALNPTHAAAAILAAIQGGLTLSQLERDGWPLQAALDSVLHGLQAGAMTPTT